MLLEASSGGSYTLDYSTTNIQVKGVDEADIVKTDGEYLYVISGKSVVILKGYPPDKAGVLSRIELDYKPSEIFVNGDWLVVFETASYPTIKVYDISTRSDPILVQKISTRGTYFDSRMIDDYVYVIIKQHLNYVEDNVKLPVIWNDDKPHTIGSTEIGYFDESSSYYKLILILALNLQSEDLGYAAYLMDTSHSMYVSLKNIYLTRSSYYSGNTTIHKISITRNRISYVCSAEVPGRILNQFSMDEYKKYFRIATQKWNSGTNVYVLDKKLNLIGKLEGIAPGEQMHSARFMGKRCYLVTFKKVDPFFVIDLKKPKNPKVLGELKIPGYSDYLHPYDENHIIGLGKDTVEAEGGNFAWFQGVKLSLFEVTDVETPIEKSKYVIGDRGTYSDALQDHKAFMFSKSKNLLIIPVHLAEINESKYPDGVPPNTYGEYVWQGAYVFWLTADEGFALKGRITHLGDSQLGSYGYFVKRALYIEDYIYTISEGMIKINSMDTIEELYKIELK